MANEEPWRVSASPSGQVYYLWKNLNFAYLASLLSATYKGLAHRTQLTPLTKERSLRTMKKMLRVGRVSVAIRRLVHHSWYGPAGERPSWAGTSWTGTAGQGQAQL